MKTARNITSSPSRVEKNITIDDDIKNYINKVEEYLKNKMYDDEINSYKDKIRRIVSKYKVDINEINPNKLPEEDKGHYFDYTLNIALLYANENYRNNNKEQAQLFFEICSKSSMPEIRRRLEKVYLNPDSTLKDTKSARNHLFSAAKNGHVEANNKKDSIKQIELVITREQKREPDIDSGTTIKGNSSQLSASNQTSLADIVHETGIGENEWMSRDSDSIKAAAENDDKDKNSQFVLGYMYEYGIGVEKDIKTAIKWYTYAINNGHLEAKCNLGYIYEKQEKYKLAFCQYESAAKEDCTQAQYNLASFYAKGMGTKKNSNKARHWFERAAVLGHHEAYANLGYIYWKENNIADAKKHYSKAAKGGVVRAKFAYAHILLYDENPEPEKAECLFKICDEEGYLPATNMLGYLYERQDHIKEALKHYMKAVKKDYAPALNNLALLFIKHNLPVASLTVIELLKRASTESDLAKKNLQILQKNYNKTCSTYLIKQNFTQEFKYPYRFFQLEESQNALGWYELGLIYQYAKPGMPDNNKALQHYFKAKNNPAALYKLATMYYLANGVKQDLDQAIKYLEKVKTMTILQDSLFICPIEENSCTASNIETTFCIKTSNELLAEIYCALGYLYENKGDHVNMIKYFLMSSHGGCSVAKEEVKEIINQQNLISINKY